MRRWMLAAWCVATVGMWGTAWGADPADAPFQYKFEGILIPPATADEPRRESVSVELAETYLEQGSLAWNGHRKCVSCHTNGAYMQFRPALSARLGKPSPAMREHFLASLEAFAKKTPEEQQESVAPAQAIYLAAGLAEWDAHVTRSLSPETDRALRLMLDLQRDSGTWGSLECWPPYESSAFHLATTAAMAIGTAPGWLAGLQDDAVKARVERLKQYLVTEKPRQDYDRTLLLWASTRLPGLLSAERQKELVELVLSKQQADGGWSIRSFGAPEEWGAGNRAEKLRAEPEFATPPSDGHQTGLAIVVLRELGVPANDPRIQRGVTWLKGNQRASGRWWTRSLNTDSWHFITYSGTALPLLALSHCDALPPKVATP
ncbi:MAG: prenyltransferase/squalene oxidase repeat-containing protein [Planctomycetaceae bacterium]